jgi:hypothetical protein
MHYANQRVLATARQLEKLGQFVVREAVQVLDLFVGHDHQMASGIRVSVQQGETGSSPRNDKIRLIITGMSDARKKAFGLRGLGSEDVLDPPWGMQGFHRKDLSET